MTTTASAPFRASRYTTGAVLLHWAIALLVAAQLASGLAMTNLMRTGSAAQFDVYQLHKSFGITVLLLTVARILWRLFNPPPPHPASVGRWEGILANVVQFAFYGLLIAVPLAGWVVISAASVKIETVLFFQDWLPFPHLPGLDGIDGPTRAMVENASATVHTYLAFAMLVLIVLHVAGALKHHLADHVFLSRMGFAMNGEGPRRSHGRVVTVLSTLVLAAGLIGTAAIARRDSPAPVVDAATAAGNVAADTAPMAAGQAPDWQILSDQSTLGYAFRFDSSTVTGTLGAVSAEIRFAEDNLGGSSIAASVALDGTVVTAGGVNAGQIKGAQGLAVSQHPTARFQSDTIERGADGGFVARGPLTARGVTHEVSLPFTLEARPDGLVVARGTLSLDRVVYGFAQDLGSGGPSVGPQVDVEIMLIARPPEGNS